VYNGFTVIELGNEPLTMPEWHGGAGLPGYLFVDEIVIK
jgi:hexosaminidase